MSTRTVIGPFRQRWFVLLVVSSLAMMVLFATRLIQPQVARTGESFSGSATLAGPIVVSTDGSQVWVANPDSGSVTVVDPIARTVIAEIPVGGEPWSVTLRSDGGEALVLDRSGGRLIGIDPASRAIRRTVAVGPEPQAMGLSQDGGRVYVTGGSDAELVVVDADRFRVSNRVPLDPEPAGLAILPDGRVLVVHGRGLQPNGTANPPVGLISVIAPAIARVTEKIALGPDRQRNISLTGAPFLAGNRVWIPLVRATPDAPRAFNSTVFAALTAIDLTTLREDHLARIDLSDEDLFGSVVNNPVVVSATADRLYVIASGSNLVEVVDLTPTGPRLVKFLAAGRNPRGLALSPDGRTGYVMSYLSRTVTVLDLANLTTVAEIPVTTEPLEPAVLRGKILFNDGADPRLTKRGWISCASCHPDGGHDGVAWSMTDGPRRTPPMWNGTRTLPWHWSAALDEGQDVEGTIRDVQQGLGLLPTSPPGPLGSPIAGRSADLDALAAYLDRGIRTPAPPTPLGDVATGRAQFQAAGCPGCHGGAEWTCSMLPGPAGSVDSGGQVTSVLRDVGTLTARDIRGALGFRPPSLVSVALKAPYFHDGSMPSLDAVVESGHPRPGVRPEPTGAWRLFAPSFSGGQRTTLAAPRPIVAFLRSIGSQSTPISIGQWSATCLTGPF